MRAIGLNKVFNNIEVLNRVMHQHNELSIENLQFTLANEIIPQKSFYGGVMSVINRGGGAWSGGFDITLPQNLDGPGGGVAFMLGVTLSLADEMEHNYQGWVERRGKAIIKSTVTIFMRFVESIPLQMKFVMTKKLLGENAWEAISGVRSSGIDEKPTALWKRVTKFTGVILSDSAKKKDALFMRSSCVRFRNLTSKISKEDLQRIMDVASERFNFNVKRGAENIFVDIASTDIAILNITRLTDKIKRNIPARSIINILKKRSIDTDERYLGSFIKHCNNKVNLT